MGGKPHAVARYGLALCPAGCCKAAVLLTTPPSAPPSPTTYLPGGATVCQLRVAHEAEDVADGHGYGMGWRRVWTEEGEGPGTPHGSDPILWHFGPCARRSEGGGGGEADAGLPAGACVTCQLL